MDGIKERENVDLHKTHTSEADNSGNRKSGDSLVVDAEVRFEYSSHRR
jgi:hypothetical protein